MADGFRLLWIALGIGGTAALVHRALKIKSAEASTLPQRPRIEPPRPPVLPPSAGGDDEDVTWWGGVKKTFSPSVEFWRQTLEALRNGVPLVFLLSWLQKESRGNACSTGFTGKQDPLDGKFKYEAGIGQQYFEAATRAALDDVMVHGVSLRALRAPCSGQTQTRPLTSDEKAANVRAFLGDVAKFRATSHVQLASAGINWPESTDDFWMMVKLQHGLPCAPSSFLKAAAVADQARSFAQFKAFVNGLSRERYTELTTAAGCGTSMARYFGHGVANAMNNSEEVGRGATS